MEIFLFIIAAGVIAHLIGASVHEGIFVGALVCAASSQASLNEGQKPASRIVWIHLGMLLAFTALSALQLYGI